MQSAEVLVNSLDRVSGGSVAESLASLFVIHELDYAARERIPLVVWYPNGIRLRPSPDRLRLVPRPD